MIMPHIGRPDKNIIKFWVTSEKVNEMDIKEVDKIILQNFKSLGWEPDVEITNIQELEVSNMAKLMIKCLFLIDTECDLPHSLPHNMAQRFRCAAKIAEIIKNLGYHGDLGYQTILYPNEVDLRKLFMFLIEKIPKDSPTLIKESQGRSAILEREARKKLNQLLQRPWVPSHCMKVARKYRYSKTDFPPLIEYGIHHCHLFSTISNCSADDIVFEKTVVGSKLLPSLLNSHAEQLGKELSSASWHIDESSGTINVGIDHGVNEHITKNYLSLQSLVPDHKSYVHKLIGQKNIKENDKEILEAHLKGEEAVAARQCYEKELVCKLKETELQILEIVNKNLNLHELLEEGRKKVELEEKNISSIKKTALLATDSEANIEKLKMSITALKEKEEKLLRQWQDYKDPLQAELEELQFQVNQKKDKKKEILEEIAEVRQQMRLLAIESTKKEALFLRLRRQQGHLPKGVNRSVYTKQILDISSKVRKQKQEIEKVLRDTRLIQKEINNLTGKVDRTFAVAEDASFKAATSNEKSRPIYRAVISIHEECGQLVDVIHETGNVQKEISDLEEQVNSEKAKTIEVNLKKLQEDLNKIKLENSVLKKRMDLTNSGGDS